MKCSILLGWKHSGFSVHNGKPLRRDDAAGLERVAQYIIRNPFSEQKMVYNAENGTVIYRSRSRRSRPSPGTSPARSSRWAPAIRPRATRHVSKS